MTAALLRSEPRFVRWAVAEGVSMLGTAVSSIALPVLVYQITGSAAITALLFALRALPYLCIGLIAGPIADRGNRRLLIIGGNVVEGVLVASVPIASLLGVLTVAHIYVVALGSATMFVFSDAAVFGAVPALVGPKRLPAANGFLSALQSGSEIVGPALAGILVTTIGATATLWIDAASFFVAAVIQTTIRSTFRTSESAHGVRRRIRDQLGRAVHFIRHQRTVATLMVAGFGNSLAFGIVIGLLVPFAVEELDLSAQNAWIGMFYGALGVGSMIAGLLFARIFDTERIAWITPISLAASAVLVALMAVTRQPALAIVLLAGFSATITFTIMVGITYRQLATTDDLRSTVNVIGRMIAWGGQPFGAALGAFLATVATVSIAYALAALVMAATAIGSRRRLRRPAQDVASRELAGREPLEELIVRWDEMSTTYLLGREQLIAALVDRLRSLRRPVTVLDLGCGPGTLIATVANNVSSVKLIGIDSDPVLLALADRHLSSLDAPVQLIDGTLEPGWAADDRLSEGADVIVAMLVLHYFPADQWPGLLGEARDLLRRGGMLVIIDVTPQVLSADTDQDGSRREATTSAGIDWDGWWTMAAASNVLGISDLLTERRRRTTTPSAEYHPDLPTVERLAFAAGFASFEVAGRIESSYLAFALVHQPP